MKIGLLTLAHMDTGVTFYHPADERAFFEWLERIPCVASLGGWGGPDGPGIFVKLKRRPGDDDLRQLLAICQRYGVDMRQLAKFETEKNRSWFRDPLKYWYKAVFGRG
jgi:hypothetical protein